MEAIDAKLKHLGSSIDKVREDVREVKSDVKELRVEGQKRSEAIASIKTDIGTAEVKIKANERRIDENKANIRDAKLLIWKILAMLAAGGYAADKILN